MKISEMIKKLEDIKKEHGDISVYEFDDGILTKYKSMISERPNAGKVYHTNWGGILGTNVDTAEDEIYDIDLKKPVSIGVIL